MSNRTRLFAVNTIASSLQQIVLFAAGLVIPNTLLRYYGSEINGLVTSVTQFISYITLIEAGISASIIFYLYKPLAEKDMDAISSIVSAAKITYTKLGWLFIVLSVFVATGYGLFSHVSGLTSLDIFILVMAIGVSGALEFFTMARYRVLLTADQKVYVLACATSFGSLLNITITVICAVLGLSIVGMKIMAITTVFARSVVLSVYLRRNYSSINYRAKPNYKALAKRRDALYMQVLWSFQSGAPVIIITVFTNMVQVSIYSIYNLVIYGINSIVSIFMSGLQAAFGEILVLGDKKLLKKIYEQFTYAFYSALTIVYAITSVMLMPFIRAYTAGLTDADIYYIPLFGLLFFINGYFFSIKTPQGMMVIAAGYYKETKLQTTIQGSILLFGGILLTGIFKMGLYGVIIAAMASNVYRAVDFVVYISKYIVLGSALKTLKYIVSSVILIAVVLLISYFIPPREAGYIVWIIDAVRTGGISVVLVIIWSLLFERKNFFEMCKRVKSLF